MNQSPRLAVLPLLAVLAAAAHADPAARPSLDTRVDVSVKQAPLGRFLDTISQQSKLNFILSEGLEERKVTAFLHKVTVKEALDVLLKLKGLEYYLIAENTYMVAPKTEKRRSLVIGGGPELDQKVTVDLKGSPLEDFIETLSAQTKVNFVVAEGLEQRKVTAFLKNVKARDALSIILAVKNLSCEKTGENAYVISPSAD